tara:strand:- start:106 stop:417 length:312 start_codon:yes stop_codon:yes gene_type:complete
MNTKLKDIAYGRSGDKGMNSNVGLIFINKDYYEWAKINLTTKMVKNYMSNIVKGDVIRYELDNIYALNFILHDSLGGGGSESLLNDAQGKTHAQILLNMKINL